VIVKIDFQNHQISVILPITAHMPTTWLRVSFRNILRHSKREATLAKYQIE